MKKKILHLITGLEIGGAEMMLLKTLPEMQGQFDNRVCCIMGRGPIGKNLESLGVQVYYLDLKNNIDFRVIPKFRKIIKEFKPDVLVTYLIHADLFGRIFGRIFGIKKIICSVRIKLVQVKYLPLLFLDALTSGLVSHYHFNSRVVADMYHQYFFIARKKMTVIPNGIEIEKYQDANLSKREKKKELGLPPDKTIIGCVAKLRKQKGHKYLISAFSKLLKNRSDVILILVGDGKEKRSIEEQANKLKIKNNVIILGNRLDIPEILETLDVFVLATLFEGMSNAILEAMASSLPIIATNISENREIIENDKTGILVPVKNANQIKVAVEKIISNSSLAAKLGNNARRRTCACYNIENTITQLENLFGKI